MSYAQLPISPESLAELIKLIDAGTINGKTATTVWEGTISLTASRPGR